MTRLTKEREQLLEELEVLQAENQKLHNTLSIVIDKSDIIDIHKCEIKTSQALVRLVQENQKFQTRIEKLRSALTHYSDGYQYDKCTADETIAQEALKQDEEEC